GRVPAQRVRGLSRHPLPVGRPRRPGAPPAAELGRNGGPLPRRRGVDHRPPDPGDGDARRRALRRGRPGADDRGHGPGARHVARCPGDAGRGREGPAPGRRARRDRVERFRLAARRPNSPAGRTPGSAAPPPPPTNPPPGAAGRPPLSLAAPAGDDTGPPGERYTYPTDSHFAPGILDLTKVDIAEDSGAFYFG